MTDTKKIVAVLTGRPPVTFAPSEWPLRASSDYKNHDGQVECQANRTWEGRIRARQHADGRWLVYGVADYSSNWQNERNVSRKAGALLPASELARDCVADLPPEELA